MQRIEVPGGGEGREDPTPERLCGPVGGELDPGGSSPRVAGIGGGEGDVALPSKGRRRYWDRTD